MKTLVGSLLLVVVPLVAYATTPLLHSRSAIVYDVNQRQVLLEKNPDEVAPLASLTKLMTGMIVLDLALPLEDVLTVAHADVDQLKHSRSRIPVGATLEREEMLRLALMSSENRAASALSRAIDGGQSAFIQRMNEKAQELGMIHTHFVDPTGLSPQNVSTARDIVKLANAASRYPLIHAFTTLSRYAEEVGARMLRYRNTDPMVGRPGWDIQISKTGFINEAGRCIVMEVNLRNGPMIIALMGARSSGARSADLTAIRNWLEGNATPRAIPAAHYESMPTHHRKAMGLSHNRMRRPVAHSAGSASKDHGPRGKRKAGKRHHR